MSYRAFVKLSCLFYNIPASIPGKWNGNVSLGDALVHMAFKILSQHDRFPCRSYFIFLFAPHTTVFSFVIF